MSGEIAYIHWLRKQQTMPPDVVLGPGDDCAVVHQAGRFQLLTTDMLMDGVDFLVNEVAPQRIGRKAMAVNLSDVAAMAGVPNYALVSVALPRGQNTQSLAEGLFSGMKNLADQFGVTIIGGDTNTWHGPLVISITLLGEAGPNGYVTRAGAQAGDWLFVTGPLGGSLRGHHLDFTPRVREALELAEVVRLKAMIDLSDGLSTDLHHILEESGCGARIDNVPVNDGSSLEGALTDGEDFELLFAVSPVDGAKLLDRKGLWKIGECTGHGATIVVAGAEQPLTARGWQHHFGN
jgi:thiamine-monophosphate kinase